MMCEPSKSPSARPELNEVLNDEEFMGRLFGFCWRFAGNYHDAEDRLNDVLTRVFRKWHLYDPTRPLEPWIWTIARNYCFSLCRKKHVKTQLILEDADSASNSIPADCTGPSLDEIVRHEDRERLKKAIDALPLHLREVLILAYWDDLTRQEIAAALGVPVGTVFSRLNDARYRLSKAFPEMRPAPV